MKDESIKHLEFIQSNISRMGQNSFRVKGWSITIVAALLALYAASMGGNSAGNTWFIFVAILPTIIFWFLDSYYLQQERKFRGIYDDVANLTDKIDVKPFEMPLHKYIKGKYSFLKVAFSRTIFPLYLPIIVGLAIFGFILKC